MTEHSFEVFGLPKPAGSKRAFVRGGRAIVTDDCRGSREWKNQVADAVGRQHDGPLLDGPLELQVEFWLPRPKSHFGSGRNADQVRPSAPTHPAVKPDLLKLTRAVEDALTGVLWRDDALIVSERLAKRYTTEAARTVIRVRPVEVSA